MTLNQYQTLAARTISCHEHDNMRMHALHGLAAETGELIDAFYLADPCHDIAAVRELGDVCWMLAELCTAYGWNMADLCNEETKPHRLYDCMWIAKYVGELHGIYQKRYQGHRISEDDVRKCIRGVWKGIITTLNGLPGYSLNDVLYINIDKLRKRYPDGFDVEHSLHRTPDDT